MNLLRDWKKLVSFALAAGIGCFVMALLAEPLFFPPPLRYSPPAAPGTMFCLTFDDSGSMDDNNKREAVKQAAKIFVRDRDLEKEKIGIVAFSSSSHIHLPLSHDKSKVLAAIDSYSNQGGTYFTAPLQDSIRVFDNDSDVNDAEKRIAEVNALIEEQNARDTAQRSKKPPQEKQSFSKIVLFFTDGQNADQPDALRKAIELREKGILLFAVSTQDGDRGYLGQMTGDATRVFMTSDQKIADAFKQVEQAIEKLAPSRGNMLTGTQEGDREEFSATWMIALPAIWSSLLCFGMALALIGMQNRFLRKPLFPVEQVIFVTIASVLAGAVAGFVGQIAFSTLDTIGLGEASRLLGWALLGTLLAFGTCFFIPNLNKNKACQFGAAGGALGVFGYWIMTLIFGDSGGRLLGAFILGFVIGLLVAFVETVYRNVWLMVVYDPRNFTQVNLGTQLVTIGSGKSDIICIPNVPAGAGSFYLDGDKIRYKDAHGTKTLMPGERIQVGGVELVVCSNAVKFAASKFYPMKMSRARELQK